jgi:DNA-binding NtrC family response regulator
VVSAPVQRTDARFVAATHVDLASAVEQGRFRADLLSRLERWHIHVAPLRRRKEDIIPLAEHFACSFARRRVRLTRSLALALLRYDWPANVRELQSVIEQAVVASRGAGELTLDDTLMHRLRPATPSQAPRAVAAPRPVVSRPGAGELAARFRELNGNARRLAAELSIGRTTLYRWFADAGIDIRELRTGG